MSFFSDDEELFIKRINDIKTRVIQNSHFALLKFLNPREQELVKYVIGKSPLFMDFFGGFRDAEMKRCIIAPFPSDEFKIVLYKINYNKRFLSPNHRSILGSLMALGIKRDNLGDIIMQNGEYYFFVASEISDYIKTNFTTLSNKPITLEEIEMQNFEVTIDYETKNIFASSLRLDLIIAEAYNLSRNESREIIEAELVKVNYKEFKNAAYQIKIQDLISVRGKGRIKILSLNGFSKSGKQSVTIGILK